MVFFSGIPTVSSTEQPSVCPVPLLSFYSCHKTVLFLFLQYFFSQHFFNLRMTKHLIAKKCFLNDFSFISYSYRLQTITITTTRRHFKTKIKIELDTFFLIRRDELHELNFCTLLTKKRDIQTKFKQIFTSMLLSMI